MTVKGLERFFAMFYYKEPNADYKSCLQYAIYSTLIP